MDEFYTGVFFVKKESIILIAKNKDIKPLGFKIFFFINAELRE